MLASIVMPAYVPTEKRFDFFRQALDSALAQTHKELEIVIIDGGSTEDLGAHVAALDDDRIRCFHEPYAPFFTINVNKGIRRARGEAVMFLSADDMLLPPAMEHRPCEIHCVSMVFVW